MIEFIILSILLLFLSPVFQALRLKVILKRVGEKTNAFGIYKTININSIINLFSPFKIGYVITRPLILKKIEGTQYKSTISASLIEQSIDIVMHFFIFLICILLIGNLIIPSYTYIAIIIFSAVFLFMVFYTKKTIPIVGKIIDFTPKRLREFCLKKSKLGKDDISEIFEKIQERKNKTKDIVIILVLSLIAFAYQPIILYFFLAGFEAYLSYAQVFAIYWLPFFLGRISGLPSGIGVRDGAMVVVLTGFGIGLIEATSYTILFRILLSGFTIVVGSVFAAQTGINILKTKNLGKK